MKTTENISLAGYAFTVETDACEELEIYLNEIKKCFSADPNADEIVADIEERIAEILRERCPVGTVIDLTMVQYIKRRIGDPKDMDPQESEEPRQRTEESPTTDNAGNEKNKLRNKHLYRNIDEKVLGGVCSGLGTYFNLDKVFFRIVFLVLFVIGFFDDAEALFAFSTIAYICLWIAMPAARTDEQKREMKGKPLNLENYKSKDFHFEQEVKDVAQSPAGQAIKRAGGVFLGFILLLIGLGGLLGAIVIPTAPKIIQAEMIEEITEFGYDYGMDPGSEAILDIICSSTFWGLVLVMLVIFCVWFIYGGIMIIFDLKTPSWRPGLILFIAWIISIFAMIGWFIKEIAEILPGLV